MLGTLEPYLDPEAELKHAPATGNIGRTHSWVTLLCAVGTGGSQSPQAKTARICYDGTHNPQAIFTPKLTNISVSIAP